MKLNFEICKKCSNDCYFSNCHDGLNFFCQKTSVNFVLNIKVYNSDKFDEPTYLDSITRMEWEDIKQMKIIKRENSEYFDQCPFKLEHLVGV